MESLIFAIDGREDIITLIKRYVDKWDLPNRLSVGIANKQKFSDGEVCVDFADSVRGKRVYLLTSPNTPEEIMKLYFSIDAAKRAGAKEIIPILPYFPYARQDKKDQSRGPIGAKVIAKHIEVCGATSIITFDLHADQIQGFFDIPVTHIEGKNVFDKFIYDVIESGSDAVTPEVVLAGPDAGSGKRVKRMKDQLARKHNVSVNYVMLEKTRSKANEISEMIIIGDVKGKDVIIIDDMVDTAGTLCKAADVLIDAGAKSVRAVISHGVLSGNAFVNIGNSKLKELIVSDSLPEQNSSDVCSRNYNEADCHSIIKGFDKIHYISVCEQIGFVISALNNEMSYEMMKSIEWKTVTK